MSKVAVVTCVDLPEPDVDESLLMNALANDGIAASLQAWDDPNVEWEQFDLAIIRSTWNYPEYPDSFRQWICQVRFVTKLLNPPDALLWNIDKSYLLELAQRGIPIVPTRIVSSPGDCNLGEYDSDIVIKPTISAGSWLTKRFSRSEIEDAMAFISSELRNRGMMIQPYLNSVENGGEIAWVCIDGEITHGVKKAPRFHEGIESVSERVEPLDADRKLCKNIISAAGFELLYARIDVMLSEGEWLLSELEIIEPSLFFRQDPAALARFVQSISKISGQS